MAALCRACCRRKCFLLENIFLQSSSFKLCSSRVAQKENVPAPQVVIPAYIPRGPTDVLKALASTVGRDPTAPHYVYHDDPYLIPTNYINKRTFVLSKESGRRAARYFLENFPDDFENDEAEPKIPGFNPPLKLTEISEVTTDTLREMIHTSQVQNSLQAYSNLKKANVTVEHDILCELLEMLCFHNSTEPADENYRNEKWVHIQQGGAAMQKPPWNDDGPAEKLFEELEVKDARAYRALILGLTRHNNYSRALQLYSEMKEKGFVGSTKMYNSLIGLIPNVTRNADSRWEKAEEFLQAMVQEELQPDLITFNTLLFLISRMPGWPIKREKSKAILAEMKVLGIEPSLGTFNHILNIFCSAKGPASNVLYDIINFVEFKTWELRDPNDMTFFITAIAVAHSQHFEAEIGHRLYAMLHRADNLKFIVNGHKESVFYTYYIKLVLSGGNLKEFFDIYESMVPHEYIPEAHLIGEILNVLKESGEVQYIPKLWSDILVFQMERREEVVLPTLSAIVWGGLQDNETLKEQLTTVAWNIFEHLQSQLQETVIRIQNRGDILGDILTSCLNGKSVDKAWEVVRFVIKNASTVVGEQPAEPLMAFCKVAMEMGEMQKALTCLGFACDNNMPEAFKFLQENSSKLPEEFLDRYSGASFVKE